MSRFKVGDVVVCQMDNKYPEREFNIDGKIFVLPPKRKKVSACKARVLFVDTKSLPGVPHYLLETETADPRFKNHVVVAWVPNDSKKLQEGAQVHICSAIKFWHRRPRHHLPYRTKERAIISLRLERYVQLQNALKERAVRKQRRHSVTNDSLTVSVM